jgi:hypothetical protein
MRALRVIMSRLLTKLGHEVEFAEDGTLASAEAGYISSGRRIF